MAVISPGRAGTRSPQEWEALCVVVNGNASGAAAAPVADRVGLLREDGADVELVRTHSIGELESAWRMDDGRRLVLVGGDGTIHAAANLEGPPRDLALIPAGRANNIARSLGIPAYTTAFRWRGCPSPPSTETSAARSERFETASS